MNNSDLRSSNLHNRRLATPASDMKSKTGRSSLYNSKISQFNSGPGYDPMRESNFTQYTAVTDDTGREKLEIKSNIRSIHAYKKHVGRNVSPDILQEKEVKLLKLNEPVETKEDIMKKMLNNPENILLAHEPGVTKNPVVIPINRQDNPEIEIRPLKEDVSLKNRDLNNPRKIKKRRRRSLRKKRKKLSNIDVSSNSQGFCSMASM